MVETNEDRSTGFIGTTMTQMERGAWNEFLLSQGLKDIYLSDDFSKTTNKHFTWQGNNRGNLTLSRIDRFYANQEVHSLGGSIGAWPTLTRIADHAPVHCLINEVMHIPKIKASFHKKMLQSQEGQDKLKAAWTAGMIANLGGN